MNSLTQMSYLDAALPAVLMLAGAIAILPFADRNHPIVRLCAVSFTFAFLLRYIVWRVLHTLPPASRPIDLAAGLVFMIAEVVVLCGSASTLVILSRTLKRTKQVDRNIPWLQSLDPTPLIDVLICTYNEEEAILERTIVGALATNYPNARIWICDDKRRPWLRDLSETLGIGYLTRPDNAHAKAGNINSALKHLAGLPQKPEFIAILDADFVPARDFLTRTATLMREPDVGVVQTPQHFFNADPIQRSLSLSRLWPDEQSVFFDVIQPSKDAWGAPFCCGTSSLIRYSALQEIGGFPTDAVTEDYLLSIRLHERGIRTVYLNEGLSHGLAPEGLAEYNTQRGRWCLGVMQIWRGVSAPWRLNNNLPLIERVMLVESFIYWTGNYSFRLLCLLIPSLYLLFGINAVDANVPEAMYHVLPYYAAQIGVMMWLMEWRVLPVVTDVYQLLCATDILKSVYVGLFRPLGQKFKVTAKGGVRDKTLIQWPLLRIFLALLGLNVLGICSKFLFNAGAPTEAASSVALFWSWYNIIVLSIASYVCFERPQRRQGDRFATDERVEVVIGERSFSFRAIDVSAGGIRLSGAPPLALGEVATLRLGDVAVQGRLARVVGGSFAFQFQFEVGERLRMLQCIYSGRYSQTVTTVSPGRVAGAVAAELLGA